MILIEWASARVPPTLLLWFAAMGLRGRPLCGGQCEDCSAPRTGVQRDVGPGESLYVFVPLLIKEKGNDKGL